MCMNLTTLRPSSRLFSHTLLRDPRPIAQAHTRFLSLSISRLGRQSPCPESLRRRLNMDIVIRASDTLKVVTHNQYDTLDHIAPDNVPESPFELFRSWLTGVRGIVPEAEAMSLSTATASGIPSSAPPILLSGPSYSPLQFHSHLHSHFHSRLQSQMQMQRREWAWLRALRLRSACSRALRSV